MPETPETVRAVTAEMRAARNTASDMTLVSSDWLDHWADRIEAAVARERNAHVNDVHDALYMATGIPGDAAAMRSALEKISNMADLYPRIPRSAFANTARTALAAPARNCDVPGRTLEELARAFRDANCDQYENSSEDPRTCCEGRCVECVCKWMLALAEGGDHA